MINYGYILKQKERDNPSPFCRASYLFSNVGDLIYCYGRLLRFPSLREAYKMEMKLAIADILMQCRLIEEENNLEHHTINQSCWDSIDGCLITISVISGILVDHICRGMSYTIVIDNIPKTGQQTLSEFMDIIGELVARLGFDLDDIENLGFLHVMERYEQFEKEGWK